MSQYPPYQPGPYSDPTASSHSGGSQRPPYAPGPPYGPGGAPFIPPPVFVIPPPSPEETANRSRRTTRGLALGGVITGVVSETVQLLTVLLFFASVSTGSSRSSGAGSTDAVAFWFVIVAMSIMVLPWLIGILWATSFGLSLAACVRVYSDSSPQPAHWDGARSVTGALLAVSVLQGAPAVTVVVVVMNAVDYLGWSRSDPAVIGLGIGLVCALALLITHAVLIAKIRSLADTASDPRVPYA